MTMATDLKAEDLTTRLPSFLDPARALIANAKTSFSRTTSPAPSMAGSEEDEEEGEYQANALSISPRSSVETPGMINFPLGPSAKPRRMGRSNGPTPRNAPHKQASQVPSPSSSAASTSAVYGRRSSVAPSPPRPRIPRRYIEKAIKDASDALEEDRKTSRDSYEFAIDGLLSSINWLLGALEQALKSSPNAIPAPKKAQLRANMLKSAEKLGGPELLNRDPAVEAAAIGKRWWPGRGQPTDQNSESIGAVAKSESEGNAELVSLCLNCGNRVSVKVPYWMAANERKSDLPKTWQEAIIATLVAIAVSIKNSRIPWLITQVVALVWQTVVVLDNRFQLHQRLILFLSGGLEFIVLLDREFGVARRIGEVLHVLWEASVRATLAFARAEGYRPNGEPTTGPNTGRSGTDPVSFTVVGPSRHRPPGPKHTNSAPAEDMSTYQYHHATSSAAENVRAPRAPANTWNGEALGDSVSAGPPPPAYPFEVRDGANDLPRSGSWTRNAAGAALQRLGYK